MRISVGTVVLLLTACAVLPPGVGTVTAQPSSSAAATGSATDRLPDWPSSGLPASRPLLTNGIKGYELYSAQSRSGVWHFFLLEGTNRMKTAAEILAAGSVVDGEALVAKFAALPPHSEVFWINQTAGVHMDGTVPAMGLPPEAVQQTVRDAATKVGLILTVQ